VKSRARFCLFVGILGLFASGALAARVLYAFEGDPTAFVAFGRDASELTEYGEQQLGRPVVERADLGHDGKFYFALANDPWLTDPDTHASVLDRPRYRAQRILYPVIASLGGLLDPARVVWGLLIVNVIAMGLGTWAVATLAADMGGSPLWGLAYVLNVGFVSEQNIDGAGVVAAAAVFAAIVMVRRGRLGLGIALLAAGALAREAMLVGAAGTALWLWRKGRPRDATWALLVPVGAVTVWAAYVRFRLGFGGDVSEIQEIGWPLVGVARAFELWLDDPVDFAVGVSILALLILFTRRAFGSKELIGWGFLGFVPLALLFSRQVWASYFDISRAVAPLITAFLLLVFIRSEPDRALEIHRSGDT